MKKIYYVLAFICYQGMAQIDTAWVFMKEADGIKVYTKQKEGSAIKATKLETHTDVSLEKLCETLVDFEKQTTWLVNCSHSELLERNERLENYIYYVIMNAPWPVMDRDVVASGTFSIRTDSTAVFDIRHVDDYLPTKKGLIRMPMIWGQWRLTKQTDGRIAVIYKAHGDPGGAIPAWLVNRSLVADPIETIKGFIENARER